MLIFIMIVHLQGNILEKYVGTGMVCLSVPIFKFSLLCVYAPFFFSNISPVFFCEQFGAASGRNADLLFLDKKEIGQLLKIVRSQC